MSMRVELAPSDVAPPLIQAYGQADGLYDEMRSGDGSVRPQWRGLVRQLSAMGPGELQRRWQQGQRMIQDNGVTYNVYGDPRGMDRPWQLDPVPMIVDAGEWAKLEAALIQRARLLNAICCDLYGPQTLLHDGRLPPELVLGHPGFLRPCHNLQVPRDRYLTLYGVDVARSATGQWWVLNDRLQAPSGAGYALENRLVMSRMLPGVFRDCRVTRLARFFGNLRDTLRAMSPSTVENPRVVLLTPGPFNETFFEHAYLARYMGFTLVQGDDLTVRDNKVFLKTLGGLRRVDVILRRLDDSYCDPLELRSDSAIGVPGLVQAAWAGNVAIANALGTGLLETPGFMPFYPGLCRKLLGEEELLPSVAMWWCGQPRELRYVTDHLAELVIKPAYPGAAVRGLDNKPFDAIFGDTLTAEQRQEMIGRIRQHPAAYAAQETVSLSTAPVLDGDQLRPRAMMMRVYVAATDDSRGYAVMPGGLTRFAKEPDSRITSMQRGGGSKDTWVVSDKPVSNFSLIPHGPDARATVLSTDSFDLPSRVADNLFWLGRYLERSESLVRLLRAVVARLTDDAQPGTNAEVPALLHALDTLTVLKLDPKHPPTDPDAAELAVLTVMFDAAAPYGLADTLTRARRLASIVRDRISVDTWRILSQLDREYQQVQALPNEADAVAATADPASSAGKSNTSRRTVAVAFSPVDDLTDALDMLDRMIITLAAFTGLGTESMLRNQGWRFLDMGRRLERATNAVDLLGAMLRPHHAAQEGLVLDALLEVMASAMSYRQRYLAVPTAVPTADMLLLDPTNPRSVIYQLGEVVEHLDRLPRRSDDQQRLGEDQRVVLEMHSTLRLAEAPRLVAGPRRAPRQELQRVLDELARGLPLLSDAIARQFLSHNAIASRLGESRGG